MHGSVLDWVVTHTVFHGTKKLSGEGLDSIDIANDPRSYKYLPHLAVGVAKNYKRVLDIGGQDVNGSPRTYDFFGRGQKWIEMVGSPEYVSIDLLQKPGVDMVMDAHHMTFPDASFDLVLCLEVLEHDSDPAATIREAYRVLEPGCEFIMTCAGYQRPAHDIHGGDGQPYNFIYPADLAKWLTDAGFEQYKLDLHAGDLRVYAKKEKVV